MSSGAPASLISTSLPLPLLAKGKVRDLYDAGPVLSSEVDAGRLGEEYRDAILFVATDRISAFDVILENGIPSKGPLLHALSTFWFDLLTPSILPSHVLSNSFDSFPAALRSALSSVSSQVANRSMLARRARVLPIEAIVRGYITGSAWKEYKKSGTVHGIKVQEGLVESQEFPQAIFTPSTKAEQGSHDENIHPDKVADLIGAHLAKEVESAALSLFKQASAHAKSRGIILADTKFEFGLISSTSSSTGQASQQLILVDEVLTPDSSRFWSATEYQVGKPQQSFDKQFVRDWLIEEGLDGKEKGKDGQSVRLPDRVALDTRDKYQEAYERITGRKWQALH
ncbi:phosphoribosylaminoimidazole-succinocarboxamide synthase [Ceraceosorus bombacis]|uniref:Phosphoribosylaminoimidazole-succinocarboxamide synthase n=1 Tax=Ceraceosorus bombacis TaxID=401625 RepID=A0A0P1BGJ0_9BASI|nr:phosphoribosylaminoimidazole-succinocarboxamide synthase [Ceraceosorus bombacis]